MMKGRIIRIVSNQYIVLDENGRKLTCVAMGKLRKHKSPVVGDFVEVEEFENQCGIQKILPRTNELIRPAIANVDQAIIVMSCVNPDFSTTLIDRLIFLIACANITPVICVSKMDLNTNEQVYEWIEDYKRSGYQVIITGKNYPTEDIEKLLENKVSVLTGQSGAGKSSLLNRIEPSFALQTQEISKALGRGKHTTRHCELHQVKNGWVADTPGFSSLDFMMTIEELAESIPDFKQVDETCRFRDCKHLNEPDCAIKNAVASGEVSKIRYEHYVEVCNLIKQKKVKY